MVIVQLLLSETKMASNQCCQYRCPFPQFGHLPAFHSDFISLPVRALGLEGEIEWVREIVPIQTLFHWLLQARRVGKLISRYWFLTAPRLLLCPRACWSALVHLFPVHPPVTSTNLSLHFFPHCALLFPFVLTHLIQQLIHQPHHVLLVESIVACAFGLFFFFILGWDTVSSER